jgi:cupin
VFSDGFSNLSERDALLSDPMKPRLRSRLLKCKPIKMGGIESVYSGPAIQSHGGGGSRRVILAGIFYFGDRRKNPLLTALPPVLVVRGGTDRIASWLKMTLNAIGEELAEEQPGSNLIIAETR